LQHQVDRLQSHQGDESAIVNYLRDQMYRVEQTIVGVRDSGTAAVNTLHNELMAYIIQLATEVVQPMSDEQLQADVHDLRTNLEASTARLRNETATLSNDVNGRLQTAEQTIAQRLAAYDARLPVSTDRISKIEEQLPYVNAALAELRVVQDQSVQLDSPTSENVAHLVAMVAEVKLATSHTQE